MKRYLLFAGDHYYPAGGWEDFKGSFAALDAAWDAEIGRFDWAHVVDSETGEIVKTFSQP